MFNKIYRVLANKSPERATYINEGHSPSLKATSATALKGRNSLLRPFRACVYFFIYCHIASLYVNIYCPFRAKTRDLFVLNKRYLFNFKCSLLICGFHFGPGLVKNNINPVVQQFNICNRGCACAQ